MSKGKTRIGLIGLCVTAAFAFTAFAASAAQAASWMVNNSTLTSGTLSVELEGLVETHLLLHSEALEKPILILCTVVDNSTQTLQVGGKATGTLKFRSCKTFLSGVESAICKPVEPIVAGGTLEVTTHKDAGVTELTVLKGTGTEGVFTEIEFGTGSCAVPTTEVSGTAWIKDCLGKSETELLEHLIEEDATAAAALGGLKFGVHPASILGSVIVHLKDGGVMRTFSVLK